MKDNVGVGNELDYEHIASSRRFAIHCLLPTAYCLLYSTPMLPGEYRREYAAYCSALARAHYEYHTGRAPARDLAPLRERYADLWTRAQLADLERALRDAPAHFETERTALRLLVGIARRGHVAAQTREVAAELASCVAAARVAWAGARVATDDVPELLAHEPDAARRGELAARWCDALRTCDDLRAARLAAQNETSAALGFDTYAALLDHTTCADAEQLAHAASTLLAHTAATYDAQLRTWAAHSLPPPHAPAHADAPFFARLAHLDQFFPAVELPATYAATMAALGIRIAQQPNLRVEWRTQTARAAAAACFAIAPPTDVRLSAGTHDGARLFRAFFHATGCAQQLAWLSRDTAARYPEFVHPPDSTTCAAYGFLFQYLLHDPAWLAAQRGLNPAAARAIACDFALVELHDVRRDCALLQHRHTLVAASDLRAESLAAEYAARLTEATGFRHEPALHLDDIVRAHAAVSAMRARLFAAALGEHLRTRHGRRWWATRAAADELIDLWNTGARYTVEELAALTGVGTLDPELLALELLATVSEQ